MDRAELVRILAPLTVAHGRPFDQAQWTVYFRALEDIPAPLLEAAVDAAMKRDRAFVPKPGELRAIVEQCRKDAIEAHPYKPCEACGHTGWVEAPDERGVQRAARCDCRRAYLAALEKLGITGSASEPRQVPAGELEQVRGIGGVP